MRKVLFVLLGISLILVFYIYSPEKAIPDPTESEQLQEEPIQTTAQTYYPLTGQEYLGYGNNINQRPIAVVIENTPEARPQSGLGEADIVFEFYAEGRITRFVAIYQSKAVPEKVGPVRSARPYFLEAAKGFDAFFVAHGYSDAAKEILDSGYIDNVNGMQYDGVYFKRSTDRVAPHNSYTSGGDILKAMSDLGFSNQSDKVPKYKFYKGELDDGTVNEFSVSYADENYDNTFKYDSASNKYTRYVAGEPSIQVSNVMVISAEHGMELSGGNRIIDLKSGGECFLFQNGNVEKMEWKNVAGKITPYRNGVEAEFVPGTTWVNVLPGYDFQSKVKY